MPEQAPSANCCESATVPKNAYRLAQGFGIASDLVLARGGDRVPQRDVAEPAVRGGGGGGQRVHDGRHRRVAGEQPMQVQHVGERVRAPVAVAVRAPRRHAPVPFARAVVVLALQGGQRLTAQRCIAPRMLRGCRLGHAGGARGWRTCRHGALHGYRDGGASCAWLGREAVDDGRGRGGAAAQDQCQEPGHARQARRPAGLAARSCPHPPVYEQQPPQGFDRRKACPR